MAFDISDNRNHGVPRHVTPGSGQFARSFLFDGGASRIDVAASPSLEDLRAIRARVAFYWTPSGSHRHNLIEGFVSFALFIGPDGSLSGTIVDANGAWLGASAPAGTVSANAWHVADLVHDGTSRCLLFLDGAQVASADVRGPVRSVGPLGVTIGHWPDPPDVYTFDGYIAETELYKHDLATEVRNLIDPCCADLESVLEAARGVRTEGHSSASLMAEFDQLLEFALDAAAKYRAAAGAEVVVRDSIEAIAAFRRGDGEGYRSVFARAAARAKQTMPEQELRDLSAQADKLIGQLPISVDEARRLAERLCWAHGIPQDVDPLIKRHLDRDQRRPHRR